MTSKNAICPSQDAIDAVHLLARHAASDDGWMLPTPDEHTEEHYEDFIQAHRDGWEGTDHFRERYGRKLDELCDKEEKRFPPMDCEVRCYALYLPLLDVFWDTWEEEVELIYAWHKSRRKKGKT